MGVKDSIEELRRRRETALQMGGAERLAKRREQGKLSARERIELLLDADSFFEVGLLAHSDIPGMEDRTPADGKVCGLGKIDGRTVAVAADDATVLAGAGGRVGTKKTARLFQMAIDKGYPIVNLSEAGGARIPDIQGSDGLSSMTMKIHAAKRQRRVPMVSAILGDSFGSPSWSAALSDFVVQLKGTCMAVSGPRVLEVATGERVSEEELGGWELHARVTGQVDRAADEEAECMQVLREFLAFLPGHCGEAPPLSRSAEDPGPRQLALNQFLPDSSRRAYDMRELLRIVVDDQRLFDLKPEFDRAVVTALARLDGQTVGIIASNPKYNAGAMGADGCDKCCAFICLCDSFNIPLLFFHDTPGFFVGKTAETKRIPGKIINFIEALALSTVPKITMIVRKSYGMAYSNMAGPGMGADFVFAWPTADVSFMAPEVAANVVYRRKLESHPHPEQARAEGIEEMRLASEPWRAAGEHHFDDVIEPADTRRVLIEALGYARGTEGKGQRLLAAWPTTF